VTSAFGAEDGRGDPAAGPVSQNLMLNSSEVWGRAGFVSGRLQGLLGRRSTLDHTRDGTAAGALTAVELIACDVPALRARRIDPVEHWAHERAELLQRQGLITMKPGEDRIEIFVPFAARSS
jgi:hypothetical protein